MQQIHPSQVEDIPEALRKAIDQARSEPENDASWEAVDDAARELDRPEEVSLLYREVLGLDLDPKTLLRIGQRAVAFHDEWYEDSLQAIRILKRLSILEDAGGAWAFEQLSLRLTMAERWEELLGEYDRKLAHTVAPERRLPLLDEAARIAKDFAGQGQRASDYLKELLLSKPNDDQLAESLERRLERQNRHQDLIDIWGARLNSLSNEEGLATRVQIADRQLNELGDAMAALSVAEELLVLDGGERDGCRLLEEVAIRKNAEVDARRRALEILQARYAAADRSEDVIRILLLSLSVAENDNRRRELHDACASWLIKSDRHEEALTHSAALLSLTPQSIEVHSQLRTLAERTGRQDLYAAALVAAAKVCAVDERRIEILVEAGKVLELKLDDRPAATELYMGVLGDPQASDAPRLLVARRLRQLLGETNDQKRLLGVLERLASLEPNTRGQRHVLGEAAKLADQLGDVDRSLELWQRCLEASEGDLAALDARIAILDRAERWETLIFDLQRRAHATKKAAPRRDDLVRVARIYETRLFRLDQAIDVWRDIEEQFGPNAETVDSLVDLCAATNRMGDVVARLSAAVETETNEARRTDHLARLGDVYREHEKMPARAIDYYRQALEISALHEPARSGLRALLGSSEQAHAAVETLAAALTAADEWPGVLELVELRVRASADVMSTQSILLEAAGILEQRAQDPGGALTYLCRAFELDPTQEREAELKRLARSSGEWGIAVSGYQRAIERCSDPERGRQLRYQRGHILEDRIEDREAALSCYRQIVESDPAHRDAACAVARVAVKLRAWSELAWVFIANSIALGHVDRKVADAIQTAAEAGRAWENTTQAIFERIDSAKNLTPKVAHDLRRELAVWYRDHRADEATAETLLSLAVESQPDADTLRMLAELRRQKPGRPLVQTLLALADVTPDDLSVLYEAATVALHTAADPVLAKPILERARRIAGAELERLAESKEPAVGSLADRVTWWSIEELVKLEQQKGGFATALQLLLDGAALPFDEERTIALSYRAATLAVDSLGDTEQGAEICRGILQKSPVHAETLALLGGIYEKGQRFGELLGLRQKELQLEPELARRLELRLDEARILELLGESGEKQIEALRKNVEESPGHTPSIDTLEKILARTGDHLGLYNLLTSQAQQVARGHDAERAAALWARAGRLSESALGDVPQAVSAYEASVKLLPLPDVLDALARLCVAGGQHVAAVAWLEQRLRLTAEGATPERRATLLSLATALRAAGEEDRARAYLSEGLDQDPAAMELRSLLAELYRARQDWELLAPILTAGVDQTTDRALQVEYLRDAAKVRRKHLGQLAEAIPLLERAVQLEPKDKPLRLSLADGLRHAERHEEARKILLDLLEEFGRRRTPERAKVHYQLAQIARSMGNLDVALKELDLASKVDRDNIPMLKLLGDVAREKGQLEEAERAYRTLLLLLGRARPDEGGTEHGIGESSILFELYRIASELGQLERAKDLLDSALEAGANDSDEADRLEQALREAGHHDLLLRALDQRLSHSKDPVATSSILESRADVFVGLGQLELALDCRLQALAKHPASRTLVHSSWELGARVGKTSQVSQEVSALALKAETEDPELACELWLELGSLCEKAGDAAQAAKCFAQAQSTGRRPLDCLEAIERVGISQDPQALARALKLFVDNADPDLAPDRYTEALYRLGALELDQGQSKEAVEHIDIALTRNGDNQRVLQLLRSALSSNAPSLEVVELMERVARDANDKSALLASLTHAARLGEANISQLHEAVDLAKAENDEATVRVLLDATVKLAQEGGRVSDAIWAISALSEMHVRAGQAQAAVNLLEESIPHASGQDAFELRLQLAALLVHPLGDLASASKVYEHLLEEEPTNVRVWRPLFDVYRKNGNRKQLEARISSIEKAVDDPALRRSLRIERMRILIDSDRKSEAETALKALLEDDPDSEEAGELLEMLLEKQGRLSERQSLIEERLNAARQRGDKATVISGTLRLGKLLAASDKEAALEVYRASLAIAGDQREFLEAFLDLLDSEKHVEDRANILYRLIALDTGHAAEARTLELVALHKAQDDFAAVERALERGLERVPDSEALHAERVQWYRQHDAWDKLAGALCDHALQLSNPLHKKEQIEQAALIYENQVGDPRRAAETLERAADDAAPDPALLAKLAQHWLSANEPSRALSHLTRALELHRGGNAGLGALFHLRGNLHLRLGRGDLENLNAAILDLKRATELSPEKSRHDLAEVLTTKLELLEASPDLGAQAERGPTTLELARVLGDLNQLDAALALINGWVASHPDDKHAQLALGHLAVQRQDWPAAITAYRGLLPLSSGEEQVEVALKLAEACEKAGDPLGAKDALELVNAQFPAEEAIRKRLRKMYQSAKAHKGWANLLVAEADASTDRAQRFELYTSAGDLYKQAEEGALAEARSAYVKALALEDDAKTIVKLVDIEVTLGQIEEAASRLDEAIRSHGKRRSPELSLLQHAMARVASAAGDEEAIFAWLEAALYSDRQNGAVASELATLAMARGEFDIAIKALQLVTLLKTPGPMGRAEAYLRQAAIAKHRGDIKKSALLAKRAITTEPEYQEAKVFLDELQISTDSLIPEA
jgi:tetratricopeptide (TPR) repeat protein